MRSRRSPALLGLLAFTFAAPGANAALSFSIQPSRGATTAELAPAPLGVFFETSISNGNFLAWRCAWSFDDPGAGSWTNTGLPKNTAIGPIAAHVFETPGTYDVTLQCSNGNDTGSATVRIHVDDPDAVFTGTDTVCLSRSGDFSGCPAGAERVTDGGGDLDQAIGSRLAARKRFLVRRGETWTSSGTVRISNDGPGQVGAFGSGAKPVVRSSFTSKGPVWSLEGARGWTWYDLAFVGSGGSSVNFCGGGCGESTKARDITWVRVDSSGYEHSALIGHWGLQPSGIGHDGLLWFGGVLRGTTNNIIFAAGERMAWVDLDLQGGFHNFRTLGTTNSVFQHIYDRSGEADSTIRGVHGLVSERIVVSDNHWTHGVKITPNNNGTDSHIRYVVYERNFHDNATLQFQATDSELRHNVCTRTNNNCFQIGDGWSSIAPDPARVRVYYNAGYRGGTSGTAMILFQNAIGSGNECRDNYVYAPSAGGVRACQDAASGGSVAISGNLDASAFSTSPFSAGSPSTVGGFEVNSASGGGQVVAAAGIPTGSFVGAYDDPILPPLTTSDPPPEEEPPPAEEEPPPPEEEPPPPEEEPPPPPGDDESASANGCEGAPGGAVYCEDFDAMGVGIQVPEWYDTEGSGSLSGNDSLFDVVDLNGNQVLRTTSSGAGVGSHYVGTGSAGWADYEVTGRMRVSDSGARIGVGAASQYPDAGMQYRLSSNWGSGELEIHAEPTFDAGERVCSTPSRGTGVFPAPGTWYRFRFRVQAGNGQNLLKARVWPDGASEPASWQAECAHLTTSQPASGTIGAWSGQGGAKYWDDLTVVPVGGTVDPEPAEELGRPGQPVVVQ